MKGWYVDVVVPTICPAVLMPLTRPADRLERVRRRKRRAGRERRQQSGRCDRHACSHSRDLYSCSILAIFRAPVQITFVKSFLTPAVLLAPFMPESSLALTWPR